MLDLFESSGSLRYFRECIEQYGLIPLLGCSCGCSSQGLQYANASEHFELLAIQNAQNEQEQGFRGMVELRFRNGGARMRPYWMMPDIMAEPSNNPSTFAMVFHDEIIVVHGRNLEKLLDQVTDGSKTVTIAEFDPEKDRSPLPGEPIVDSIVSYRKNVEPAKPH